MPSIAPLALGLLAGAAPAGDHASAADGARLLVVPADGTDEARVEEIYAGLRAAGLSIVGIEERAGVDRAAPTPVAAASHDEARARVTIARARFRELDLEAARAAADGAIDELLRLDRPEDATALFEEALLVRASIAVAAGGTGDDDLMLLARLVPEREALNPAVHPPSLVDAFARARGAAADAAPGLLEVRPRVAAYRAAEILIDGKAAAPTTARGPHLVVARAPGTATFTRLVDVRDDPIVLEPFLAPRDVAARRATAMAAARAAADDTQRAAALGELAALCAARAALLLTPDGALLWSGEVVPGRAPVTRLAVGPAAPGRVIGQATLAGLQAPAKEQLGLPPDDPPVATAAVVAVGVGGALLLGGVVALAVWGLAPASPLPPPARPVTVSCCVN